MGRVAIFKGILDMVVSAVDKHAHYHKAIKQANEIQYALPSLFLPRRVHDEAPRVGGGDQVARLRLLRHRHVPAGVRAQVRRGGGFQERRDWRKVSIKKSI